MIKIQVLHILTLLGTLSFTGCIQSPSPSSGVDFNSLSIKEQADINSVLNVLPANARINFVYVNLDGRVYSSTLNLAAGIEFPKKNTDGNLEKINGSTLAPAPVESSEELGIQGGDASNIQKCNFGKTGSGHRYYTANLTANWIGAQIFLPSPGTGANGVLGGQNSTKGTPDTPYLYLGGWGNGNSGIALDVGLVYDRGASKWFPFVQSELNLVNPLNGTSIDKYASWNSVPLDPGTFVDVLFWHIDDKVMISLKPSLSSNVSTKIIGLQPTSGWKASGASIRYKLMTTLAQITPESFNGSTMYMLNAKWSNVQWGYKNWGSSQSTEHGKLFPNATLLYAGGNSLSAPNANNTCVAPNNKTSAPYNQSNAPFDGIVTATGNPSSGMDVSIDFDRRTHLSIAPYDTFVTSESNPRVDIPGVKNPTATDSEAITLVGGVGAVVKTKRRFANDGRKGSALKLSAYPLGQTLGAIASTPRRIISTAAPIAQTRPADSPWDATMYTVRIKDQLLGNTKQGGNSTPFEIKAMCPAKIDQVKIFTGRVDLVYTTGRIDDFGTPQLTDDKVGQNILSLPLRLVCVAPRITDPDPVSPLSFTGTVGQTVQGSFTFKNLGGPNPAGELAGLFSSTRAVEPNKTYGDLVRDNTKLAFNVTSSSPELTLSLLPAAPPLPAYARDLNNVQRVSFSVRCTAVGDETFTITVTTNDPSAAPGVVTKTVTIDLSCRAAIVAVAPPNIQPTSITLNGVVNGGTVTSSFTIDNPVPDGSSVFEYHVYNVTPDSAVISQASGVQSEPVRVRALVLSAPNNPPLDTWQNKGLQPQTTVTESMSQPGESKTYSVSATCKGIDAGHDTVVNVEYATGGQPAIAIIPIKIHVTCSGHGVRFTQNTVTLTGAPGELVSGSVDLEAFGFSDGSYPTFYDMNLQASPSLPSWLFFSSLNTATSLNTRRTIDFRGTCPQSVVKLQQDLVLVGDTGQLGTTAARTLRVILDCRAARAELPRIFFMYYANVPLEGSFEVRNVGNEPLTYQLEYSKQTGQQTAWLTFLDNQSGTVPADSKVTVRYRFKCDVPGRSTFGIADGLMITTNDFLVQRVELGNGSFCMQPNLVAAQFGADTCLRDANGQLQCPQRAAFYQADPSNLQTFYALVMAVTLETGSGSSLVSVSPPLGWQLLSSVNSANGKALVFWKWADYFSSSYSSFRTWTVQDSRSGSDQGRWAVVWSYGVYGQPYNTIGSVDTSTLGGVVGTPPILVPTAALPRPALLASLTGGLTAACLLPEAFCYKQPFNVSGLPSTYVGYSHFMQSEMVTRPTLVSSSVAVANYVVLGSTVDPYYNRVIEYSSPNSAQSALRVGASPQGQPVTYPTPVFPPR